MPATRGEGAIEEEVVTVFFYVSVAKHAG